MPRPFHARTRCQTRTLVLAALLWVMPAAAEDLELERSSRPHSPVRDPLAAWQQALAALEPGTRIRRLAFADHILFVFHSAPGEERIRVLTLTPIADGFHVEDDDDRDPSLCRADDIEASRVEHGLRRVLASSQWQRDAARMDSLILECMAPALAWSLMPVPEGGFRAGEPIVPLSLPFEPGPAPAMPALERD